MSPKLEATYEGGTRSTRRLANDKLPLPYHYDIWRGCADTQHAFYRTSDGQIGSTVQFATSQETVWSDLGTQATQWSQTSSQFEELIRTNE